MCVAYATVKHRLSCVYDAIGNFSNWIIKPTELFNSLRQPAHSFEDSGSVYKVRFKSSCWSKVWSIWFWSKWTHCCQTVYIVHVLKPPSSVIVFLIFLWAWYISSFNECINSLDSGVLDWTKLDGEISNCFIVLQTKSLGICRVSYSHGLRKKRISEFTLYCIYKDREWPMKFQFLEHLKLN